MRLLFTSMFLSLPSIEAPSIEVSGIEAPSTEEVFICFRSHLG